MRKTIRQTEKEIYACIVVICGTWHVWKYPNDDGVRWMANVAQLFRQKQMETSVAPVIEAVQFKRNVCGGSAN